MLNLLKNKSQTSRQGEGDGETEVNQYTGPELIEEGIVDGKHNSVPERKLKLLAQYEPKQLNES